MNAATETEYYPTDREILAAIASELCAECMRLCEEPHCVGSFEWVGSFGYVKVFACDAQADDPEEEIVIDECVVIGAADAAEQLRDLLKRVAALGVEG